MLSRIFLCSQLDESNIFYQVFFLQVKHYEEQFVQIELAYNDKVSQLSQMEATVADKVNQLARLSEDRVQLEDEMDNLR